MPSSGFGSGFGSDFLNTDDDFDDISTSTVEKPEITLPERPIRVAEELQNLDI